MEFLRKTKSVCPDCIKEIDAQIVEKDEKIYMLKECKKHGKFKVLLSKDAGYYKELSDFYFELSSNAFTSRRQRIYNLVLTSKCNLNCQICFANANVSEYENPSLKFIKNNIKGLKNIKINLFGGEPTLREDLSEIIEIIKKSGNIVSMYTNGIKIADYNYLKKLRESGLDEVHLQFDGFDDSTNEKIRSRKLLKTKQKALKNLRRLSISTVIEAIIVRGLNKKEMIKILNLGLKNNFIKSIVFRSYAFLGRAGLDQKETMTIDELIDVMEKQTNGKISKTKILEFQKSFYVLSNFLSIRNCFNNQFFPIFRENKNFYRTINDSFDFKSIEKNLEKFKEMKNRKIANLYLISTLLPKILRFKTTTLLSILLSIFINKLKGNLFHPKDFPENMLLLDFERACDKFSLDYEITKNCIGGEIRTDRGVLESKCLANILRERHEVQKL